jgi:phosphoglycerate kinase
MKMNVKDIDVADKKVLVRVDFNVPLENGNAVADDSRIRAALPTIQHLIYKGARILMCSHLGRPKGTVVDALRLDPVAKRVSELLDREVHKLDDCIGPKVTDAARNLEPCGIILLENTRFHEGEADNDAEFASRLAEPADIFVNDAFAAAHRAHASTEGVAHYLPAVAGLLMEREIRILDRVLKDPEHPFVALLGGAKISDKIQVVEKLLERLDALLVGGGMANTILKAKGIDVGRSFVEENSIQAARDLLDKAGDRFVLPVDAVIAEDMENQSNHRIVSIHEIPEEWKIVDIGPQTVDLFRDKLSSVRLAVWNGPLGVAEKKPFDKGTVALAEFLAETDATSIIGGGDTGAVIKPLGIDDRITHISTGGGAFLKYMEGRELPGIAVLKDK